MVFTYSFAETHKSIYDDVTLAPYQYDDVTTKWHPVRTRRTISASFRRTQASVRRRFQQSAMRFLLIWKPASSSQIRKDCRFPMRSSYALCRERGYGWLENSHRTDREPHRTHREHPRTGIELEDIRKEPFVFTKSDLH